MDRVTVLSSSFNNVFRFSDCARSGVNDQQAFVSLQRSLVLNCAVFWDADANEARSDSTDPSKRDRSFKNRDDPGHKRTC
jgi:hypothetical protein